MRNITKYNIILVLLFISIPAGSASIQTIASDTVQAQNTSSTPYQSATASLYLPISQNITGTQNYSIQIKAEPLDFGYCGETLVAHARIYNNGTAFGTEQTTSSTSFVWKNQTISGSVNVSDLRVDIWGTGLQYDFNCENPTTGKAQGQNFRLMYDYVFPDPPENDITHIFSNYTTWPLGQTYTGSSVAVDIIPRVNKTNPYDYSGTNLSSNRTGWWHLDDNLTDVSGQNHNGTLFSNVSSNYQTGEFNNATYFNSKTYINTSTTTYNFGITQPYTFIFWVKSLSRSVTYPMVFATLDSTVVGYQAFFDTTTANTPFAFSWYGSGGSIQVADNSGVNITNDGIWHQYIVMHNGSGKASGIKIYRDSVSLPTFVGSDTLAGTVTGKSMLIGSRPYAYDNNFTSSLDEIQVLNRTLNQSEINSTYFVKPSNLRVKTNSGVESWSGYWNNYDLSGGDSPINFATGGSFNSISVDVPVTYNQSGVNVLDFQKLAWFNITANMTPSLVYFVSPTKVASSEAWNQNSTTIAIHGTKNINSANLSWTIRPDLPVGYVRNSAVTTDYSMNKINSTDLNLSFSNLFDGFYSYSINVSFEDGNYSFLSSWTRINLTLPSGADNQNIFLYQYPNGTYRLSRNASWTNATFIEPEFTGFLATTSPFAPLYECYNGTVGTWKYTSWGCYGGEVQSTLTGILPDSAYNIHTYPLIHYTNASGFYIALVNRTNLPTGYVWHDGPIGYVKLMFAHQEDLTYINNSRLKVGFDKKFGFIVYLSTNLSGNLGDGGNVLNGWDAGQQLQNDYDNNTAAFQGTYEGITMYLQDWNPLQGGSKYNEPNILVNNFTNSSTSVFIDKNATNWNPDWGNTNDPKMRLITTYSFDGENPVLKMNMTYLYYDTVNRARSADDNASYNNNPAPIIRGYFNDSIVYYNTTISATTNITTPAYGCDTTFNGLYLAAFNSSDESYGVGIWNWGRPRLGWCRPATSISTSEFGFSTLFIAAQPSFGVMAYGTPGYTRSNYGSIFVGNVTAMTSYYAALEYAIGYDPSVQINKSIVTSNLYVQVNTTDIAKVQNSTLHLTNGTGNYVLVMTVNSLQTSANITLSNLADYNYSYWVSSNATTGTYARTDTVWTNIQIPPASIMNLANITGTNYINWTWADPADADFDHIEVYLDGAFQNNVTKGLKYFNATGLTPLTSYTIGTHTVDTSGNVNATWVNNTAMTNNNPPNITFWGNNKTNDQSTTITINVSELVKFNATANQTITTWSWFKDSINQSTNYDNITLNWSTSGRRNVSVNGSNINGTTQFQYWTVEVRSNIPYRYDTIADSYVRGGINQNNNFGNSTILYFAEIASKRTILNFSNISGYTYQQIKNVSLNINVLQSFTSVEIYTANAAWNESGITWNNQPTGTLQISGISLSNGWNNIDITQLVKDELNSTIPQYGLISRCDTCDIFDEVRLFSREDTHYNASYIQIILESPPNITSYWNNINGWNQTTLSVQVGNTPTFNITTNQTPINVEWKVDGTIEQNTSSQQFSRLFNSVGTFNVTAQANNTNGNSQVVYTVVTVTAPGGGGGGTTYYRLQGWVTDDIGAFINGASVWTSQAAWTTGADGKYGTSGYVYTGTNYWINVTKTGYTANNTSVLINTDPKTWNVTLTAIAGVNPPNFTSWGNDNTTNNTLSLSVEQYTNITFNATANQTLTGCTWTGATQINCTADTYAFKNFTSVGAQTVSISGSNANGSTQTVIWNINVNGTVPPAGVTGGLNQSQVQTLIDANNSTMFIYGLIGGILGCYVVLKKKKEL